jgi:hypothetical protein
MKLEQNITQFKEQIGVSRVCPEIELDLKINTLLNL